MSEAEQRLRSDAWAIRWLVATGVCMAGVGLFDVYRARQTAAAVAACFAVSALANAWSQRASMRAVDPGADARQSRHWLRLYNVAVFSLALATQIWIATLP